MDYRRLVIGDWLLDMGYGRQSRISAPLHSTLYTISDSALASNLSPLALLPHLPAFWQCFDADAAGRCRSGTK